MSSGAYEKLEGARARKFIERLNRAWIGGPFAAETTVVHARTLPFAEDWMLTEAGDATIMPEKRAVALDNGRECVPVEYNADFIPAFAAANAVCLTRDTAADYLRFWLEYMRAGPDRFLLVESLDDLPWREEPTPQARKSLAKSVTPLTLVDAGNGLFVFRAVLAFRDALIDATFSVTEKGGVEILKRTVIAEGLTLSDELTGF
ncbi:MAG: hypothetical protein H6865_03120 [Rhodospirillales bacterium]|nr:hypothetical protein [Alphaproteobacteria bacterium]MCB9986609.1 hypothetical protein [Rhodospirillales bacterium]USO06861.1 MAG: hypothetical protein H6866_05265 [Rhodospirillales bacterium]